MTVHARLAGCAAAVAILGGCVADRGPTRLTVDVFSGRENPTWELDADLADRAVDCIQGRAVEVSSSTIPDGLGFRAFVIEAFPAQFGWRRLQVTPKRVEGTDARGDVHVFDCPGLYAALRADAAARLPDLASEIPEG